MNAYELADGGEHIAQTNYSLDNQIRGYLMDMAIMLRQQADRIEKLELYLKASQEARIEDGKYQADRISELEKLVSDMIYEKSSGVYDKPQTNAKPVAWMQTYRNEPNNIAWTKKDLEELGESIDYDYIPLYTTPQTKPLSDEEIVEIYESVKQDKDLTWEEWCITWEEWCKEQIEFARAIEERILK